MSVRMLSRVWDYSKHAGTDLLMMLAIADFADDEGAAYPSVSTLAAKCRTSSRNVSYILSRLRDSGELAIRLNEGPHGANLYRITLPLKPPSPLNDSSPPEAAFTPPEAAFMKPPSSPPEAAFTPPEAGFMTPLKPASPKPSVNRKQTKEERADARADRPAVPKFDPKAYLADLGIAEDLVGDWLTLRKQHKAPATKTAITMIEREAKRAGISLDDALQTCCARGWRGFSASWLQDKQQAAAQTPDAFQGAI